MNLDRKRRLDFFVGGLALILLKPFVVALGRLGRRDHSLRPRGDVLVLKLLGGGSLVLAYNGLRSLKDGLSEGQRLLLVTTPALRPFAEELGLFSEVLVIDDSSLGSLVTSGLKFMTRTFFRIDTCIDFEIHSRGTALLTLLCGARNRLGFFKESLFWRSGLYTHLVFYNTYSLSAAFYERLLGLVIEKVSHFDESVTVFKKQFELSESPSITLGFACSGHATERMMTPKQWVSSLRELLPVILEDAAPPHIELLGTKADHSLGETMKAEIEANLKIQCTNLCGALSLHESVTKIAASRLYVGIDSGLLHFARLLGKDAASYWGPTDPTTRLAPRTEGDDFVHYQKVACSPCVHFADIPPCMGKNRCIDALFDSSLANESISWVVLPEQPNETRELRA